MARELDHTSTSTVEKVYAKLGQVHHRSKVVEYRIEQPLDHAPARERMKALRAIL